MTPRYPAAAAPTAPTPDAREPDTLVCWTGLETIMGFTAIGVAAALSLIV
jgi:hypothetical protein